MALNAPSSSRPGRPGPPPLYPPSLAASSIPTPMSEDSLSPESTSSVYSLCASVGNTCAAATQSARSRSEEVGSEPVAEQTFFPAYPVSEPSAFELSAACRCVATRSAPVQLPDASPLASPVSLGHSFSSNSSYPRSPRLPNSPHSPATGLAAALAAPQPPALCLPDSARNAKRKTRLGGVRVHPDSSRTPNTPLASGCSAGVPELPAASLFLCYTLPEELELLLLDPTAVPPQRKPATPRESRPNGTSEAGEQTTKAACDGLSPVSRYPPDTPSEAVLEVTREAAACAVRAGAAPDSGSESPNNLDPERNSEEVLLDAEGSFGRCETPDAERPPPGGPATRQQRVSAFPPPKSECPVAASAGAQDTELRAFNLSKSSCARQKIHSASVFDCCCTGQPLGAEAEDADASSAAKVRPSADSLSAVATDDQGIRSVVSDAADETKALGSSERERIQCNSIILLSRWTRYAEVASGFTPASGVSTRASPVSQGLLSASSARSPTRAAGKRRSKERERNSTSPGLASHAEEERLVNNFAVELPLSPQAPQTPEPASHPLGVFMKHLDQLCPAEFLLLAKYVKDKLPFAVQAVLDEPASEDPSHRSWNDNAFFDLPALESDLNEAPLQPGVSIQTQGGAPERRVAPTPAAREATVKKHAGPFFREAHPSLARLFPVLRSDLGKAERFGSDLKLERGVGWQPTPRIRSPSQVSEDQEEQGEAGESGGLRGCRGSQSRLEFSSAGRHGVAAPDLPDAGADALSGAMEELQQQLCDLQIRTGTTPACAAVPAAPPRRSRGLNPHAPPFRSMRAAYLSPGFVPLPLTASPVVGASGAAALILPRCPAPASDAHAESTVSLPLFPGTEGAAGGGGSKGQLGTGDVEPQSGLLPGLGDSAQAWKSENRRGRRDEAWGATFAEPRDTETDELELMRTLGLPTQFASSRKTTRPRKPHREAKTACEASPPVQVSPHGSAPTALWGGLGPPETQATATGVNAEFDGAFERDQAGVRPAGAGDERRRKCACGTMAEACRQFRQDPVEQGKSNRCGRREAPLRRTPAVSSALALPPGYDSVGNTTDSSYYRLRYTLFHKYDEGMLLDENAWFETTVECIAAYLASVLREVSVHARMRGSPVSGLSTGRKPRPNARAALDSEDLLSAKSERAPCGKAGKASSSEICVRRSGSEVENNASGERAVLRPAITEGCSDAVPAKEGGESTTLLGDSPGEAEGKSGCQRRRLKKRTEEMTGSDDEPPPLPLVAMDGCCGAGGNVIQFARFFDACVGVDCDLVKVAICKHNASLYGVRDQVEFSRVKCPFCVGQAEAAAPGSCAFFSEKECRNEKLFREELEAVHASLVSGELTPSRPLSQRGSLLTDIAWCFMSPPWSGPSYSGRRSFRSQLFSVAGGQDGGGGIGSAHIPSLVKAAARIAPNVCLFLPRSTNVHELAALAVALRFPLLEVEVLYSHFIDRTSGDQSRSLFPKAVIAYLVRDVASWIAVRGLPEALPGRLGGLTPASPAQGLLSVDCQCTTCACSSGARPRSCTSGPCRGVCGPPVETREFRPNALGAAPLPAFAWFSLDPHLRAVREAEDDSLCRGGDSPASRGGEAQKKKPERVKETARATSLRQTLAPARTPGSAASGGKEGEVESPVGDDSVGLFWAATLRAVGALLDRKDVGDSREVHSGKENDVLTESGAQGRRSGRKAQHGEAGEAAQRYPAPEAQARGKPGQVHAQKREGTPADTVLSAEQEAALSDGRKESESPFSGASEKCERGHRAADGPENVESDEKRAKGSILVDILARLQNGTMLLEEVLTAAAAAEEGHWRGSNKKTKWDTFLEVLAARP
ncbi:UNVERIFIED_CONTAM: RNA cap guanine-N2 methyltransferase [Hammondia hammondi]|eukprot:XP_008885123.1 RNA cap guanine-N2 methyltransferase [Hammondia hammondi]